MKLLIDTNVVIDYLADRAPFADYAEKVMDLCAEGTIDGLLTASAATDIYYVMRKMAGHRKTLESLGLLLETLGIADVGKADLLRAMELDMPDFEDALVAVCAKRVKAEYIVTRNVKHFAGAPVKPVAPEELLKRFFPDRITE